jgi:hypothetical protein
LRRVGTNASEATARLEEGGGGGEPGVERGLVGRHEVERVECKHRICIA